MQIYQFQSVTYEQSVSHISYNMLSLQTPKLNWGPKRRVRETAAHTVPTSPARVAMTTQVTYVNTHNRTGINEPARSHQMSH